VNLAPHLQSGQQAEDLALAMLQTHGLKLLLRNYRCPQGELDLVLTQQDTLVVVEVRFRRDPGHGSPAETVGRDKQHKLILATRHFLQRHAELRRKPLRFDVVAITAGQPEPAVEWIQDAFQAP
jgi:putative endonuclease